MVVARSDKTAYHILSYFRYVKETFHNEPLKHQEFLNIVNGISKYHRVLNAVAKIEELMKDHPELIPGFTFLLPTPLNKRKEPKPTLDDSISYISSVKSKFRNEPAKFYEFLKILKEVVTYRVDEASGIGKMKELIKDKPKLLSRLSFFLPDSDTKNTINPKAEKFAEDFIKKLKTRFQSFRYDTHVYKSFLKIMNKFKEGKISAKKMQEKVLEILYYHDDLIKEFNSFFS